MHEDIQNEYFEWLFTIVCAGRFAKSISYRRLLAFLHNTDFTWMISRDSNRAAEGEELRNRFASEIGYRGNINRYLDGPCSVLEMMIALAIHCEENIMDDPNIGDRTQQWFWGMIVSLGLGDMRDSRFDRMNVEDIVDRFLNRKYRPDGKGGLFTIRGCDQDLRDVEIWIQLCWYLDSIMGY